MRDKIEIIDEPVEKHIVKVRYIDGSTGEVNGREYTYFSEESLNVGDVVIVPIKDTTGKAKVTAVDVPESEIAAFQDKVKTIPAGSITTLPVTQPAPTVPPVRPSKTGYLRAMATPELSPAPVEQSEPYEKSDALLVVEQKADDMSVQVFMVKEITTPELHQDAEKWLSVVRIQLQDLEKARVSDVKKPNEYVKWINSKYKEKSDLLRRMEQHCLKVIGVFRQRERENQEHEQQKADRLAERQFERQVDKGETPAVPVPVARKVEGLAPTADTGEAKNIWGTIWTYEIVNPALLPREALMANEKFIGDFARLYEAKAVMGGVRFFEKDKVQVRRSKVEEPE